MFLIFLLRFERIVILEFFIFSDVNRFLNRFLVNSSPQNEFFIFYFFN